MSEQRWISVKEPLPVYSLTTGKESLEINKDYPKEFPGHLKQVNP